MSLSNPDSSFQVPLPALYDKLSSEQKRAVRKQYTKLQHNECFFCGDTLYQKPQERITEFPIDWDLFPEGFLDYPVHLQHDHSTGLTEGAVHSFCNAFMWNYYRR